MLSIALARIDPDAPAPFPLYVLLEQNDRMIPVRLAGDPLGREMHEQLLRKEHVELWVPQDYAAVFAAYLESVDKSGSPVKSLGEAIEDFGTALGNASGSGAEAGTDSESKPTLGQNQDQEISGEQDAGTPEAQGSLLDELKLITLPGPAARTALAARFREIVDSVLILASQSDPLFASVLALRSLQEPTEHSVFTGSLCGVLAIEAGITDEAGIANLVTAATFHDVGMAKLSFDFGAKPRSLWSPEEWGEYRTHVERGVAILRSSEPAFPAEVVRIVAEHHEKADGSGFPRGLVAAKLHRATQVLAKADRFDRLLWGEESGKPMSPAEAFGALRPEHEALPGEDSKKS